MASGCVNLFTATLLLRFISNHYDNYLIITIISKYGYKFDSNHLIFEITTLYNHNLINRVLAIRGTAQEAVKAKSI